MNARKFSKVRVCLTMTALALCGALVVTASCASNGGGSGGATGSNGGSTVTSNGGSTVTSNGGTTVVNTGGVTAPSGSTVTFATGKAQGAMTGYGWIAMGTQDSASSPTCGTTLTPITNATPCASGTNWSGAASLCISGSIPVVTADTAFPTGDYTADWGLQIGVNATDDVPSKTLGSNAASFSKITVTMSGTPPAGAAIRAEIHRLGDTDQVTYCATMQSGTPITLTAFNTACWDGSGTSLVAADIQNIDKIGVQISADMTSAYTVSNYCLTGIAFQ